MTPGRRILTVLQRSFHRLGTGDPPFRAGQLLEGGTMVSVDDSLCTGCQICASVAPETFEMDGGVATAASDEVTPEAEQALQQCPSGAIDL